MIDPPWNSLYNSIFEVRIWFLAKLMSNRRVANFYKFFKWVFFFFPFIVHTCIGILKKDFTIGEWEYKHDIKSHLIFISNHMKYPFLKPEMDKVLIKWEKKRILEESIGDGSFVELALKWLIFSVEIS